MSYMLLKLMCYMLSLICVMYGLNCINFEKLIKKDKVGQFYAFYSVLVISFTYLMAHFFLDFMTIHLF